MPADHHDYDATTVPAIQHPSRMSNDTAARNLLGWTAEDGTCAVSNAGETLKRSLELLSSDEGKLTFKDSGRDPLLILNGYFRVIRCSLDSTAPDVRTAHDLLKRVGEELLRSGNSPVLDSDEQIIGAEFEKRTEVALRYFQLIITDIHPHLNRKGYLKLLGPTYRLFSEVAVAFVNLLEREMEKIERLVKSFLPSAGWGALSRLQKGLESLLQTRNKCFVLFEQAGEHVLGFLSASLDRIQRALDCTENVDTSALEKQSSKIVVFLFARLATLILLTFRRRETLSSNRVTPVIEERKEAKRLTKGFVESTINLVTLSLEAQSQWNSDVKDERRRCFLQMVIGLQSKAEQYLIRIATDFDSKKQSAAPLLLESLIQIEQGGQCKNMARLLLCVTVTKNLLGVDRINLNACLEAMTRLFRSITFDIMPSCYQCLSDQPHRKKENELVWDQLVNVLESVSHTFCFGDCENYDKHKTLTGQHRVLLAYLARKTNHPLTNQLLLQVMERRVVLSTSMDDDHSKFDAVHLSTVLVNLLFHERTAHSLRRSVAVVLFRVLSRTDPGDDAKMKVGNIIFKKLDSQLTKTSGRKRKRSGGANSLLAEDIATVSWVLRALGIASANAQLNLGDAVRSELNRFWDCILDGNSLSYGVPTLFISSLAEGIMYASRNAQAFLRVFAKQDVNREDLMKRIIAHCKKCMQSRRKSPRREALIHSSCVELMAAAFTCFGNNPSEAEMKRMGSILMEAQSHANSNSTILGVDLRYRAVLTASKFGAAASRLGDEALGPVRQIIINSVKQKNWYNISPNVTTLHQFILSMASAGHKGGILRLVEGSRAKELLTARVKKEQIYSVDDGTFSSLDGILYSTAQEAQFLAVRQGGAPPCIFSEGGVCHVRAGSRAKVCRDRNGRVLSVLFYPSGCEGESAEDGQLQENATCTVSRNCNIRLVGPCISIE